MALSLDNFKNQPPVVIMNDDEIIGLSEFKNNLEKLFFSKILIRNSSCDGQNVNLFIEISCNFKLWEAISNLDEGIWAQYRKKEDSGCSNSKFYSLICDLKSKNYFNLDVEEISILFKDCTIVVNKVYQHSIPEQLDAILTNLSKHFSKITKNSLEVPYEIFVPVFEETQKDSSFDSSLFVNIGTEKEWKKTYFKYWGLYLTSSEDALIYDLEKQSLFGGELELLNQ